VLNTGDLFCVMLFAFAWQRKFLSHAHDLKREKIAVFSDRERKKISKSFFYLHPDKRIKIIRT
jgi:hypothetical protein